MIPSSPSLLPSFDPAVHLHSEDQDPDNAEQLESFSDDIEALNHQRLEQTRNRVVVQHRAWNLADLFRSDDDIRPGSNSCVPYFESKLTCT